MVSKKIGSVLLVLLGVSCSVETNAVCDIPSRMFDGMVVSSNVAEPYYGALCNVSISEYVQRFVMKCLPFYCCDQPCVCGGSSTSDTHNCADPSTVVSLSCYTKYRVIGENRKACCDGYVEDELHVCRSSYSCNVNNGGCDQLCRRNVTTDKDYCDCYEGYERHYNGNVESCISMSTVTTVKGPGIAATESVATLITTQSNKTAISRINGVNALDTGAIVGGVVGAFGAVLLVIILVLAAYRIKQRQKSDSQGNGTSNPPNLTVEHQPPSATDRPELPHHPYSSTITSNDADYLTPIYDGSNNYQELNRSREFPTYTELQPPPNQDLSGIYQKLNATNEPANTYEQLGINSL